MSPGIHHQITYRYFHALALIGIVAVIGRQSIPWLPTPSLVTTLELNSKLVSSNRHNSAFVHDYYLSSYEGGIESKRITSEGSRQSQKVFSSSAAVINSKEKINDSPRKWDHMLQKIVCDSLRDRERHREACLDQTLVDKAIASGQHWLCRSLILYSLDLARGGRSSSPTQENIRDLAREEHAVSELCSGVSPTKPVEAAPTVVMVALHEGLGNQLFQSIFGRLLAESLGASILFLDDDPGGLPSKARKSNSSAKHKLLSDPIVPVSSSIIEGKNKRSFGAATVLQALFPNLVSGAFVSSNLTQSRSPGDYAVRSCTEALRANAVEDLAIFTDIDHVWRSHGYGPGPKNFLSQFNKFWGRSSSSESSKPQCILVDGYFQKPFLYQSSKNIIQSWLRLESTTTNTKLNPDNYLSLGTETQRIHSYNNKRLWIHHHMLGNSIQAPGPRDVVIHLRTCENNRRGPDMKNLSKAFYPPLPLSYYTDILESIDEKWDTAWVVGPTACLRGATARLLRHAFPRKIVVLREYIPEKVVSVDGQQPPWERWAPSSALVADLLFLRATTGPLILSVGSFSFWAGWLSSSSEIHMPVAGRQGQYILHSEKERFVYHDLRH